MLRMQSAQQTILNYHKQSTSNSFYRHFVVQINGELDIDRFQAAILKVVSRHPVLHSVVDSDGIASFVETNNYSKEDLLNVFKGDFGNTPELNDFEKTLDQLGANAFSTKPFKIHNEPLWRSALVDLGNNQYQFGLLIHPLIADDSAINTFFSEVSSYYNNPTLELPRPIRKEELARLQQHDSQVPQKDKLKFWRRTLHNKSKVRLLTQKKDTPSKGKRLPFDIPKAPIAELAKQHVNASINDIMLTSLYILLYKYTGQADITLGDVDTNRSVFNRMINSLANLLPIRVKLTDDDTFTTILDKVRLARKRARTNSLPIDQIHQIAMTNHDAPTAVQAFPFNMSVSVNGGKARLSLGNCQTSCVSEIDRGHCDFDYFQLHINATDSDNYQGVITFNQQLFDHRQIQLLTNHLKSVLLSAINRPNASIDSISILTDTDRRLLNELNATYQGNRYDMTFPDIFTTLAEKNSGEEALVFHDNDKSAQRLTYGELETLSNQIANHLLANYRLKAGDKIGICLKRSNTLVATMLGALKAGLILVPLETEASKFFDYKFDIASPNLVITDNTTHTLISGNDNITAKADTVNIESESIKKRILATDDSYYRPAITPDSPAYMMFSSGTTSGTPKASLLPHKALTNLFNGLLEQRYPKYRKVLCTALPTFDAFFFDFLTAWGTSGSVHLSSDRNRYNTHEITRIIEQEQINFAVFLPDVMVLLSPDLPLEQVITMGRAPLEQTLVDWQKAYPKRTIINGLGHTETGICLSLQDYIIGQDHLLLGQPISNMQMHILDPETHQICPVGVPGELFISGPGLALEYVGNSKLTNEKFLHMKLDKTGTYYIECADNDLDAIKMYSSGDYGYFFFNAEDKLSLKLIGRTDRQVKLYGVSVNMDGVESVIGTNPLVKSVAVIPNSEKNGLHAFVVLDQEMKASLGLHTAMQTKEYLAQYLKDSTLPLVAHPRFTIMTTLPLTSNRKVDYKRLPLPKSLNLPRKNKLNINEIATNLWRETLSIPKDEPIIQHKSWSDYGGTSLKFTHLQGRLEKALQMDKHNGLNLYQALTLESGGKMLLFLDKKMTLPKLIKALTLYSNNKLGVLTPVLLTKRASNQELFLNSPHETKEEHNNAVGDKNNNNKI